MPYVHVDGVDLHYEIDGDAASTIVFAHGGEGTHLHWWQQVAALAPEHRCVTYDARGFGRSGTTPSERGTDVHHVDLLGLLDALEIDRAVLVGQSMGGYAVSGVAQRHPERVRGIVMADTPFGFQTAAIATWAGQMIAKLEAGFDVIANCLALDFPERRPDLAYLFRALGRLNPPRTGPRGLEFYEQMMTSAPVDYGDFAVPALFIVGDADALTVPWLIEATAAAVPNAVLRTVAGSGHSVYFEQADAFNAIVREFIASLPAT